MTDEAPRGLPNQRALGAIESAVRRARAAGQITAPQVDPTPPHRDAPRVVPADPAPTGGNRDRWLIASVVVVAVLVLVGGGALAVSLGGGSRPAPTTAPTVATTAPPGAPRHHSAGPTGPPTASVSTSSTTTTVPVVPGAAPVIAALDPSTGTPGQSVQIVGVNFLSPDGRIVATFNGQVTPTSCPAPSTCTVTVPPSSGPSAQVIITTANGISNAITFTYS